MVASIGLVGSPSQGVSYYPRDGYYARYDAAHLQLLDLGVLVDGGENQLRIHDGLLSR